jgi:hypothetical protein
MMRRLTRHEVCAQRAHLGAIEQRNQMLRFRVMAAAVKNVSHGLRADSMALGAVGDALLHQLSHLIHECFSLT